MTDDWYTSDKAHLLVAKKGTVFRRADAKYTSADVLPSDRYVEGRLFEPNEIISPTGQSNSYLPLYRVTGYSAGRWQEILLLQTARNLYPAMGKCTTTFSVAEITTVLCTTKLLSVENSTFHFWVADGAGAETEYYVWINKGTGADPTETGTAIEADISGATTAIDVAEVIDGLIDAKADVGCDNSGTATLTITNAQLGAVTDCSSSEGTDTGYIIIVTTQGVSTHTMAIRTTQTPVNMGRHWERENDTAAEDEEIDMIGMSINAYHAECSESFPVAIQTGDWNVNFTLNTDAGTDDIPALDLDIEPFKWDMFTFPTFTYNSETIEAEIVGWAFDVQNTVRVTGLDSGKRFERAKYIPLTFISTTLEIIPEGRNAFELIRTPLGSYITDLDLVVKCTRDTNDYIQWSHDKCYGQPFTLSALKRPGSVERYFLVMSQLNTGSLVPVAKDYYNNDYYENP